MQKELAQPPNLDQEEFNQEFKNQSPQEIKQGSKRLAELMRSNQPQDSASESLDLTNLPFDPALKAMEQDETEEQAIKAESIRRLRVRQASKGLQGQTRN